MPPHKAKSSWRQRGRNVLAHFRTGIAVSPDGRLWVADQGSKVSGSGANRGQCRSRPGSGPSHRRTAYPASRTDGATTAVLGRPQCAELVNAKQRIVDDSGLRARLDLNQLALDAANIGSQLDN